MLRILRVFGEFFGKVTFSGSSYVSFCWQSTYSSDGSFLFLVVTHNLVY